LSQLDAPLCRFCEIELGVSDDEGKELLHDIINEGGISEEKED